jgi:hypothetical protein
MVQRYPRLEWQDSPLVWPLAIYPIDFAIDTEFNWLDLDSSFRDIPAFRPKFLCIDNTESNQALRVFFDNLDYPIVPFQRITLPIPQKCRQARLVNAGTTLLTCSAIFSVEDISAGDTINFGLATNSGDFGVTWPIDVRTGPYNPLATDNHRVQYWFIAGPTVSVLQDQGLIPNGWTIQLWNDETSTANVTVTAAGGELIDGAASLILTPGRKVWLIWDGAEYRSAVVEPGNPEIQVFTAGGTWTPSDITRELDYIEVEIIGAGGGAGGSGATAAAQWAIGGAGGGGGYAFRKIAAALLNLAGETVTIGAGGTGGAAGANNGTAGGTSSFGALCSATGGALGLGQAAGALVGVVNGGVGGTGVGGDINIQGQPGKREPNQPAATGNTRSGDGGDSLMGFGGPGAGAGGAGPFNGNPGQNYGGGGSGGVSRAAAGPASAGGNGAPGIIIVREYYQ